MEQQVYTVSEFVAVLNQTLEYAYPEVKIEGEVASFKIWQERLVFFDLKDEEALVSCMLPLALMQTPLEQGMQVRITGQPKVTKKGRFSVNVRYVEPIGEGDLQRSLELLEKKLHKEGLFAAERKRELPKFPQRIGVVTARKSAAYSDFIEIINQRWVGLEIVAAFSQVQGEQAPPQIVEAIQKLNQQPEPLDVLVLTRGGGSLEDLMAFNSEQVIRAVAESRTPTIVAIGHEKDWSLSELAADKRAATPTDAARLAVPNKADIQRQISYRSQSLGSGIESLINTYQQQITHSLRLMQSQVRIEPTRRKVAQKTSRLQQTISRILDKKTTQTEHLNRLLKSFNPQSVLERGFSVVRHQNQVVKDASQLSVGDQLMIQLAKGQVESEVTDA